MVKDSERPVYIISVAARLTSCHPQTLRIYERKGLLRPKRSAKKRRLYSEEDIERLKTIQKLTQEAGVNLAGVKMVIELQEKLEDMQRLMSKMEVEFESMQRELEAEIFSLHRRLSPKIEKAKRGGIVTVPIKEQRS